MHGKTGLLVEADKDELVRAVKEISKDPEKYKEACMERAQEFDTSLFLKGFKQINPSYITEMGVLHC